MNFVKRIQKLPEGQKKIILWALIIIIGLALLVFWGIDFKKKMGQLSGEELREQLQLDVLGEGVDKQLQAMPDLSMPDMPGLTEEEKAMLEEELE